MATSSRTFEATADELARARWLRGRRFPVESRQSGLRRVVVPGNTPYRKVRTIYVLEEEARR